MTIDEAIDFAEDINATVTFPSESKLDEEFFDNIPEWLEELKAFRNTHSEVEMKMYEKGRADELYKIFKMILLGCEELKCDECDYRLYSQDVCQQAYTIGVIENYIAEHLKEQK